MADNWYRLDNAARVFAALASRRTTSVFRVAVTLRHEVDSALLQSALDALMPRFPYFRVRLRTGFFWHYLEPIQGAPGVRPERRAPCRRMTRAEDGPWQLRVLVFGGRIALECSHVLTDGAGALAFLTALLAEYLGRRGVPGATDAPAMRPGEEPHPEEAEDAYRRFYDPRIPPPPFGARALRLRGGALPPDECRVVLGLAPLAPLRDLSRERGVTLTELLASILLASVLDLAPDAGRPIAVMTPVNLRGVYPSRTMRNFFLSVTASIDPRLGAYTFDEILHEVHHSVQGQISAKSISRQIRRNVGAERNAFIRHIPLMLKIPAKRRLYTQRWGARYTTALSNLGRVDLVAPLAEHVERFEVIPNPSAAHGIGCALLGYGDRLSITFAGIVAGTGLERAFFTRLRRMGVAVRVETN
ncbi:MAG TPA: hypothetical protein VFF69_07980 [Phycisphaerales bacterium]|nr:hypothetical protein [Phycisphaerales bacterium]